MLNAIAEGLHGSCSWADWNEIQSTARLLRWNLDRGPLSVGLIEFPDLDRFRELLPVPRRGPEHREFRAPDDRFDWDEFLGLLDALRGDHRRFHAEPEWRRLDSKVEEAKAFFEQELASAEDWLQNFESEPVRPAAPALP